mmetsp:Transcript_17006/g.33230  ORF Transcript_17006/g.33230 Transcript_17006/m.33230 type:complete len:235 (+) Transcript_17006:374-1078(+)|eukprot:CAMPEP_0171515554 /NCGR_PEP_ID=MMETSP0959-20130129/3526_1 /TAXON_ID=87120 /ORGANISM="Aurantiochytrium limacinum, Strain ATCCMYA-1381" /LENGTH=234 /DNA_ID=CAMNT_0012054127 /DNA_START=372 /DNA_END=1076 /DNA_ORIENTATION=-
MGLFLSTAASSRKGSFRRNRKKNTANAEAVAETTLDLDVTHEDLFLEQAYQKPKDLQEVLRRPHMRNQFREFLRRSLAQENLLFFETIELYQKIDKPHWRQTAGTQMVEKFLEPGSLLQVNLPAREAETIRRTKYFEEDTFDLAKIEIFRLMNDNFFHRFVRALEDSQEQVREQARLKKEEAARKRAGSFQGRLSRAGSSAMAMIRRTSSWRSSSRNFETDNPYISDDDIHAGR